LLSAFIPVGILKYGELGAETGQLLHVQVGAEHLCLFIGLDESLSLGGYYCAVAGIEAKVIGSGTVYAYGIALVLDGTGS
jgi:hypothetical protein